MAGEPRKYILTLSCPDKIGIVHAVSGALVQHACNVLSSSQFDDLTTGRFFMRVAFAAPDGFDPEQFKIRYQSVADDFGMSWNLYDRAQKPRVMVMVSKFDHCLQDLVYRTELGELEIDIPVIVSNHTDCRRIADNHNIPFQHLPVTKDTKTDQETQILDIVREQNIELVVLARYMQVLSDSMCRVLKNRIINIHHSFLPSFKGAKPYHQAHARGVKLIGATAHFVTPDLDEGPIIEQDVARVDHSHSERQYIAIGRDIERLVLARAVKHFAERRLMVNGVKTVVFQ